MSVVIGTTSTPRRSRPAAATSRPVVRRQPCGEAVVGERFPVREVEHLRHRRGVAGCRVRAQEEGDLRFEAGRLAGVAGDQQQQAVVTAAARARAQASAPAPRPNQTMRSSSNGSGAEQGSFEPSGSRSGAPAWCPGARSWGGRSAAAGRPFVRAPGHGRAAIVAVPPGGAWAALFG